MIDSKIIVHIKTDSKNKNVDFTYRRVDKKPFADKNELLLVMYCEGIVRNMIEKGLVAPKMKGKEDGNKDSEQ